MACSDEGGDWGCCWTNLITVIILGWLVEVVACLAEDGGWEWDEDVGYCGIGLVVSCGVCSFVVVFYGPFVSSALVISGSFDVDSSVFDGLVIYVIGKRMDEVLTSTKSKIVEE